MSEVVKIKNLHKNFGQNEILKGIDFSVNYGEVVCLIGSSGSGKSTLLRCINMLEHADKGEILFHGDNVLQKGYDVTKYRAKLGMVFQQFNLFDNKTVLDNCTVGQIKVLKKNKEEAEKTAMLYLKKVGMDAYINAKPRQLSGGRSSVWLLPEPFPWNRKHFFLMSLHRPLILRW